MTYSPLEAQHLVCALYRALLGREPDAAGRAYWTDALATGNLDLAALTTALAGSDECRAQLLGQHNHAGLRARFAAVAATALAATPLRIVDVGAQILADEQHVYAALAAHGLACHIIGFEPIADKLSERRRADGATVQMYPDFIGDGGRHTFHLNTPDATSSLLPFNTVLTDQLVHLSQLRTAHTEQVATRTLDEVLGDGTPGQGTVDFLKLDIQGFELPALRHAGAVLARTNVVHCEVSFAEIYAGQGLFSEIEQLLRGHGFDFIDLVNGCRYANHGPFEGSRDRLGWGDAIFFKRAAGLGERDLLAQAAIALLVYDKPSLAAALAGPQHAALFAAEVPCA